MASDASYLEYVWEQLSALEGITHRAMMGEYILYCHGKVFGGIYDNRLLVKPLKAAVERMPNAVYEAPYPGGKDMLLVSEVDDRAFLNDLVLAMDKELPAPKAKKRPADKLPSA